MPRPRDLPAVPARLRGACAGPRLLDLPGPSRRVRVEPLVLPEPAREPAPPAPEPEPAREPVPEREPAPA